MDQFFRAIEKVQKKPAHIRRQILVAATALIGGLIFLFWLSIVPSKIDRIEAHSRPMGEAISPFASIFRSMGEFTDGISEVIGEAKTQAVYVREEASSTIKTLQGDEEASLKKETGTSSIEAEDGLKSGPGE